MTSYAVLGISRDATDDEVRLAYKHKALECHPDRHVKDKDAATKSFIEINSAYRAILRERERRAKPQAPKSGDKRSSSVPQSHDDDKQSSRDAGSSGSAKSSKPFSSSSTSSFKTNGKSTPSTSPSSSPFSTPGSSPYSTPASSPASSTSSLPQEETNSKDPSSRKRSATCEEVEDEEVDDAASSAGTSTTSHTAMPDPEPGPSQRSPPKTRRAKLRKQQPKSKEKLDPSCATSDKKSPDSSSHPQDHPNKESHRTKHQSKWKETELEEYLHSFPSLKDYPSIDLPAEWVHTLSLPLEDIFHGKRLCYRITRRYLSGKTKSVVLDVDVPVGCRSGTKIIFRDAGHERRDGSKQDVVFVVQDTKHERFIRGCEWGGDGRGREKHERNKSQDRDDEKHKEGERVKSQEQGNESNERKSRRHREYSEEDLVMEVRLPWVDRLKDEKARIVVSGIDGKEIVFEIDCRKGNTENREQDEGKVTGVYVVQGAGMPVRANVKGAAGGAKAVGADSSGKRGRLIIRWEIFTPTPSSSSRWESFKQIFTFGK